MPNYSQEYIWRNSLPHSARNKILTSSPEKLQELLFQHSLSWYINIKQFHFFIKNIRVFIFP